ncbi:MAG: 3-hydroxyisobutyrate dehydrogenase [Defluviicoccus sp.]|nr:3-hydroxyisobutyrate dehydrogenase [Defluviicoccus sp.]MDE0278626.1 3-hydroxyisobutyrate dehydrogenase [Defluviicoccus sp.]
MAEIGFVGLGNMGRPMALRLIAAGHAVRGFDVAAPAREAAGAAGIPTVEELAATAAGAEAVFTMLPAGADVRAVYCDAGGLLAVAGPDTLLVDSSTIDLETARDVHAEASAGGIAMLDAPVSGGVGGAEAGTLTFMVGGEASDVARGEPLMAAMGRNIVHAGGPGNGQAAKMCNNMILGVSMIAVSEAFALAERVGLDAQTLFDIVSTASGQCWSLTSYCPVPGPVPSSPANRDYRAGFTAAMMLKDLRLARGAAQANGANTPLGSHAASLYEQYCADGEEGSDFSGIIRMLRGGG